MSQLQTFLKVQDDLYARLLRAKSNFKKSPKDRITKQYVDARLENVEELWAQFSLTHTQMVKDCESIELTKSPYTINEVYFNTEEVYLDLKCELKTVLNKFKSSSDVSPIAGSSSNSESRNMPIKLPRISIPTFSGKYTEWITFRDLFVSLIHKNDKIDKVQKLHYLKSHLTGEAEQLLRHIQISDLNYDKCWAQLESRYNNKKYLSHCILKRLFSQRNITNESASGLKDLMDTTSDCLNALINLELNDTAIRDLLIIHILTLKLDSDSRKEWELRVTSNIDSAKLPTFEQFKDFLTSRYRAFEFLEPKSNQNVNTTKAKVFHTVSSSCPVCNDEHKIGTCKQFIGKDVDARRKFVQEKHLCFNCLGGNHSARFCKCTLTCRICQRKHHTLLHCNSEQESLEGKSTHTVAAENQEIVACFSKGSANNQVLLATALVKAVSKNGSMFTVRALLDQGSQASFVTENIVQTLGLKKTPAKGSIVGIDVNHKVELNSVVKVKIQSRVDPSVELEVNAYVLKSLTSLLPSRETAHLDWVQFQDIQLADPKYHKPDKVDFLLGAEIYCKILQNGLKKASGCSTVAQRTSLGWILSGPIASAAQRSSDFTVMHALVGDDEILKRFWELEKEPDENKKHILTEAETKCEEIFTATTTRDDNGRYIVNLPFRTEDPGCKYGKTREVAIRRFHALESKLQRNEELGVKYAEVIKEYLELGHMRPVSKPDYHANEAVYLPHHAVVRNDKDTTKVRVVFDASCKGKTGISLNDDLLVGPSLQPDLRHLLMRWRRHPICMISDVVKMYRQVRVADKHQDFQRILWRDNRDSELKDYQLQTVTFGTAAAPFLAVRAMQQVAYDEGKDYPLAAEKTLKDFYVDDLMTGCETIEEGIEICTQMEDILVDPDTLKPIEDAKKPKIDLSPDKKFACLNSIVQMHEQLVHTAFTSKPVQGISDMDTDERPPIRSSEPLMNITVGNHIISIIFTIHNVCRQATKRSDTNMIKKTEKTSFKIHYKGDDYSISNDSVKTLWLETLKKNGLYYKDFDAGNDENWYGTMGPYLDMFSAFSLRVNELRLGHNNMPITKQDGVHKSFPVAKYGLSGAHHVLLEGASFPPERRSSIVQSLGPMTSWLCMLRSEGIYRKKYAVAVKRAMSHIPCIDDIIELTKNTKQASEISTLTTLVAETILVTTSRQATRMFFPITIFSNVWRSHADKKKLCEFFSTTGAGGWYVYKCASMRGVTYTMCGEMQEEMASQIVFHGIFGTYKEDLSILSQITNIANWFTREEMGGCFRQAGRGKCDTKVALPMMRYYAKMSCANQTGLLSGVYNQVVTVPCFSGQRSHLFDSTFFDHIEKKRIISNTGKTLAQIINILTSTLEELHDKVKKENGKIEMGTTQWRDMSSLELGVPGAEVNIRIEGRNKMFLGKN